jgi:transglutaminase-like putative cysteine protease
VPKVYPVPEQRNQQILASEPPPHADLSPGFWLYRLRDVQEETSIEQSVLFDRYVVRSEILPNRVIWEYDVASLYYRHYTRSTETLPVSEDAVQELALRIVGRERNPYSRARYVYNYVTGSMSFVADGPTSVLESISASEGSTVGLTRSYVALARAAAVPARLVGGYRIDENGVLQPHDWAEFYLSGFGWVPVDPVMGGGHIQASGRDPQADSSFSARDFYFGSIDNRRITLTLGETEVKPFRQRNQVAPIESTTFWRWSGKEVESVGAEILIQPREAILLGRY